MTLSRILPSFDGGGLGIQPEQREVMLTLPSERCYIFSNGQEETIQYDKYRFFTTQDSGISTWTVITEEYITNQSLDQKSNEMGEVSNIAVKTITKRLRVEQFRLRNNFPEVQSHFAVDSNELHK
eukprot:TRINITY_DN11194_c0_g1_i1.p1 TRINITY_DN11194_c0_g1~~TRINITY_DN11194_c0_g1_i1.p1  ORF type:complete len:125 (-),score=7.26 TRINITY_DN11194_c0_g1_i1:111-485(-)